MNPTFSIITVCYNSDKTIAQTIESVLNQTFQDFEYLIIDGGSTDGTLDIIKKYESLFKDKLKCISEPDRGIYDAMNKGIKLASGNLVGIINSDDWYELDTLSKIEDSLKVENRDDVVIYGLLRYYKNELSYKIESFNHNFLREAIIPHPTCFISRNLYHKYGFFNTAFHYAADYDLIIRLYNKGVIFIQLPYILANFRLGGATDLKKDKSMLETYRIFFIHGFISKRKLIKSNIRLRIIKLIGILLRKNAGWGL